MGTEAISPTVMELTSTRYTYETIERTTSIAAMMQQISGIDTQEIALVSIVLYFENAEKDSSYALAQAHASSAHLMDNLRPLVRKTDAVFLLINSRYHFEAADVSRFSYTTPTLYFLLFGANIQGGQIVQSRLWEALLWQVHNTSGREMVRPRSMTIGHSAYPTPYADADEFIEAARNVSMYFDSLPEKAPRKAVARQPYEPSIRSEKAVDEELPTLARKLGIPYLSLLPKKLPRGIQQLVDPKLAQELHCFPLGRERNKLTVAMLNPEDAAVLDRLHRATGLHIFPVLTHPHALQCALEQLV